ncbi:MAG: hypothetical protein KF833_11380 [Verrucomicrobiae bacterium]|nr:hypothetical protein [Verrucomicrobiae bacterium]
MRLFLLFCNRLGCFVVLGLGLKVWGLEREAGSGLAFPRVPPQFGYTTVPAFEGLEFVDPVAIASPPGETNRLFVVEQLGRVQVIPDLTTPRVETKSSSCRYWGRCPSGMLRHLCCGLVRRPDKAKSGIS